MSNTQVRFLDINEAIERDRAARRAEVEAQEALAEDTRADGPATPWELWLAIGVGLFVMAIAAAI